MSNSGSTNTSGSWSKWAIGLVAAAAIVGAAVVGFLVFGGGEGPNDPAAAPAPNTQSENQDNDSTNEDSDPPTESESATAGFTESAAAQVVKEIAPNYGVDGDAAVNCMEQNVVGGFTEEELAIIHDDPTATSWPPGLAEKYAAVLEECIPLEPWYLDAFSRYSWVDAGCIQTMTDWVLARYDWVKFIQDGVMGNQQQREQLQAEFDAYVNQGYEAKKCYSG